MAAGSVYITAGLPVAKDSGQTATGNGSVFITAGLPKTVEAAPGGTTRRYSLPLTGVGAMLLALQLAERLNG